MSKLNIHYKDMKDDVLESAQKIILDTFENQKEERCMAQCGAGAWQISLIDGGPHKNIFILQIIYFKYQLGLIRNGKLSFAPVRTRELNIEFASYRRRFIMIKCSGHHKKED